MKQKMDFTDKFDRKVLFIPSLRFIDTYILDDATWKCP